MSRQDLAEGMHPCSVFIWSLSRVSLKSEDMPQRRRIQNAWLQLMIYTEARTLAQKLATDIAFCRQCLKHFDCIQEDDGVVHDILAMKARARQLFREAVGTI